MDNADSAETERTFREQEIIKFIDRNHGTDKEFVIDYCNKEGIGSRVVISRLINELIDKDVINDGKTKKNQKSYKLTVNSKNLLLIIPNDLDEIFEHFKGFVNKIDMSRKNEQIYQNFPQTSNRSTSEVRVNENILSLLKYDVIEIINDVYLFYFIVFLPYKLINKELINKLYSIYFEKISKMYSYLLSNSLPASQPYNLDNISETILYNKYVHCKGLNIHEKVLAAKKICKRISLDHDLDNILNLLWRKNIESIILLYGSKDGTIANLQSKKKVQTFEADVIYDTIDVLEKTHNHFDELIREGALSKIESLLLDI
jgi:hypothetical protein